MWLYQIRISVYAPGAPYPNVVHLFHGATEDEAEAVHAMHRRADKFLRDCEDGKTLCDVRRADAWIPTPPSFAPIAT